MPSRSRKFEIAIFIVALAILVAVWAMNGYEDTWLYATAAIIAIPTTWLYWGKKKGE